MKKGFLILLMLLISTALFAEARIGATAFYNFPLIQDDELDLPEYDQLQVSDFTFGADFRLKLSLLQGSAMALVTPGSITGGGNDSSLQVPANADIFLDGGVALDVSMLRLGLGAGPNFTYYLGDSESVENVTSTGVHLKATADVMLGSLSVGMSYLAQFDMNLSQIGNIINADKSQGLFGVSALLKL